MSEIALPDVTLHVEEAGEGEPLLLLHGGLGTALLHWWRDIPVYAERYRVIAPDLRGYGRSSPPREFPVDFYQRDADDMAALLRALDAAPAHVLGYSDGADVAQLLAIDHPEFVKRLILVGGQSHTTDPERALWPAVADSSTWSPGAIGRFREAQGPENWPGILQKMVDGYNRFMDAGGVISAGRLDQITAPTLIVHGEADELVPVFHARLLKEGIPSSTMVLWPDVGHTPQRERAAEFHTLVFKFLAGELD